MWSTYTHTVTGHFAGKYCRPVQNLGNGVFSFSEGLNMGITSPKGEQCMIHTRLYSFLTEPKGMLNQQHQLIFFLKKKFNNPSLVQSE